MRIEGHNPVNNKISLAKEVAWASQNMPRTLRQVAALPDLSGVRLACCMHLDMKIIPLVQGILDKGAQVFLITCNPTTVQDDVVAWLVERGAEACAWRNMSDADWQQSWEKAIAWQPTHLCEMGADITTLLHQRGEFGNIVAGLEATGSGVNRLGRFSQAIRSLTGTICRSRGAAQPPYGRSHCLAHLLPDHSPHPA